MKTQLHISKNALYAIHITMFSQIFID